MSFSPHPIHHSRRLQASDESWPCLDAFLVGGVCVVKDKAGLAALAAACICCLPILALCSLLPSLHTACTKAVKTGRAAVGPGQPLQRCCPGATARAASRGLLGKQSTFCSSCSCRRSRSRCGRGRSAVRQVGSMVPQTPGPKGQGLPAVEFMAPPARRDRCCSHCFRPPGSPFVDLAAAQLAEALEGVAARLDTLIAEARPAHLAALAHRVLCGPLAEARHAVGAAVGRRLDRLGRQRLCTHGVCTGGV